MVFTWLAELLSSLIDTIIPFTLPSFNQSIIDILEQIFLYMRQGLNFLCCFLDMNTVMVLLPIVILLISFKYVYQSIMWALSMIRKFKII